MGVGRAAQAVWFVYLGGPQLVSSFSPYFAGTSSFRVSRLRSLRPGDAESLWSPVADSAGAAAPAVTRGPLIDPPRNSDRRETHDLQSTGTAPSASISARISFVPAKVSSPAFPLALAAQALINELDSLRTNSRHQRAAQNNAVSIQWNNATSSSKEGIFGFTNGLDEGVPLSQRRSQDRGLRSVRLEVPLGGVASALDWLRAVAGADRSDPSLFPKVYLRNPHAKPSDDQTDDSQTSTDNLFSSDAGEDTSSDRLSSRSRSSSSSSGGSNSNICGYDNSQSGSSSSSSDSLLASGPMRAFEHAGLGAAHAVCGSGPTTAQAWEAMAAIAPPGGRFFGGERFDHGEEAATRASGSVTAATSEVEGGCPQGPTPTASASCSRGSPWKAFGGHAYVLPLVEVVGSGDETTVAVNLVWDEQESDEGYDDNDEEVAERIHGSKKGLCFTEARARAVDLLRRLPAAQSAAANPPPTRRQPPPLLDANSGSSGNSTSSNGDGVNGDEEQAQWATAVNGALADIAEGAYEKVVLARQRRVVLGAPADPLELCAALRDDHGYLFLFELDEQRDLTLGVADSSSSSFSSGNGNGMAPRFGNFGRFARASPVAFLGCTPELLFACNEARGEVVTVAIAGTRPRGVDADTDAQLGEDLMASAKDMAENRIVAEWIVKRLENLANPNIANPGRATSKASSSSLTTAAVPASTWAAAASVGAFSSLSADSPATRAAAAAAAVPASPATPIAVVAATPPELAKFRHVQHIRRRITLGPPPRLPSRTTRLRADKSNPSSSRAGEKSAQPPSSQSSISRSVSGLRVLRALHPTPAVCGRGQSSALRALRKLEHLDRGWYAGAFGAVGGASGDAEFVVAIRSCVVRGATVDVFAGAGIVPGSDAAAEWAETNTKMAPILSRLRVPAPARKSVPLASLSAAAPSNDEAGQKSVLQTEPTAPTIQAEKKKDKQQELGSMEWTPSQAPNVNALWAEAMVEELARRGVEFVVVSPGSRSTPVATALARHAARAAAAAGGGSGKATGIVRTMVHHDERGAAFAALGWAKATGRPAAVLTTSGTAVANLLPAAVEASQSSVPLLLLTADRAPESRFTGANQAIPQPGIFGTFVRHASDLPCPTDELPVTFVLEEVGRAVSLACGPHPGPVHLNLMFRENLAPDPGQIRGDWRLQPPSSSAPLQGRFAANWSKNNNNGRSSLSSEVSSSLEDGQTRGIRSGSDGAPLHEEEGFMRNRRDGEWDRAAVRTGRFQSWLKSSAPFSVNPSGGASLAGLSSAGGAGGGANHGYCALSHLASAIRSSQRGILIAGPLMNAADRAAVAWLASALQWPLIADLQSGLRYGHGNAASHAAGTGAGGDRAPAAPWLVPCHDTVVSHPRVLGAPLALGPDVVIQFGHPLVSALVPTWLAKSAEASYRASYDRTNTLGYDDDDYGESDSGGGNADFTHAIVAPGPPSLYDPVSTVTHSLSFSAADAVTELAGLLQLNRMENTPHDNSNIRDSSSSSALLCLRELGHAAMAAATAQIDHPQKKAATTEPPLSLQQSLLRPSRSSPSAYARKQQSVYASGFTGGGPAKALKRAQMMQRQKGRTGASSSRLLGPLTEPWVARTITKLMAEGDPRGAVFVSASMPVRDMDGLGYFDESFPNVVVGGSGVVVANRGASGIDGVLSTALGYAVGSGHPVTLLIGDLALLHDVGSLHACARAAADHLGVPVPPITIVVVNNGGGGIFSFLPIAQYGEAAQLSRLFTASHGLELGPVAEALGVSHRTVTTRADFESAYQRAMRRQSGGSKSNSNGVNLDDGNSSHDDGSFWEALARAAEEEAEASSSSASGGITLIEAVVPDAGPGASGIVATRRQATSAAANGLEQAYLNALPLAWRFRPAAVMSMLKGSIAQQSPPVGEASPSSQPPPKISPQAQAPCVVLLHGFMGSKEDWSTVEAQLPPHLDVVSVDLPFHGDSRPPSSSAGSQRPGLPHSLLASLPYAAASLHHLLNSMRLFDDNRPLVLVGYSLGGRVALQFARDFGASTNVAGLVLVGAHPGLKVESERTARRVADSALATRLRACATSDAAASDANTTPTAFEHHLEEWYSNTALWGPLGGENSQASTEENDIDSSSSRDSADSSSVEIDSSSRSSAGASMDCSLSINKATLVAKRAARARAHGPASAYVQGLADVAQHSGLGTQSADLWPPSHALAEPSAVMVVHGALDAKFPGLAQELAEDVASKPESVDAPDSMIASGLSVASVAGCGHAVLEEAPHELANLITIHLNNLGLGALLADKNREVPSVTTNEGTGEKAILDSSAFSETSQANSAKALHNSNLVVASLGWEEWCAPLTEPLQLPGGPRGGIHERCGFHVTLELGQRPEKEVTAAAERPADTTATAAGTATDTTAGGTRRRSGIVLARGVGEVSPLPGFHTETLEEARAGLSIAAAKLTKAPPLPEALLQALASGASSGTSSSSGSSVGGESSDVVDLLSEWLDAALGDSGTESAEAMRSTSSATTVPRSVRSGLEQALLQAVATAAAPRGSLIALLAAASAATPPRDGDDESSSTTVSASKVAPRAIESPVRTNALLLRHDYQSDSSAESETVVKVKVGGQSIEDDAARVIASAAIALGSPKANQRRRRLRLDANQAWTPPQALQFWAMLPLEVQQCVEYIEEPLAVAVPADFPDALPSSDGGHRAFLASLEAASAHLAALEDLRAATGHDTGNTAEGVETDAVPMPIALDESLAQGLLLHLALLRAALQREQFAALVLKPSLLGPLSTLRLGKLYANSPPSPPTVVISSAFDGAVGLAHHTLLAAARTAAPANPSASAVSPSAVHGLGTYRTFAPEPGNIAAGFREAAVIDDGRGHIDPLRCELLLQAIAASET